MRELKSEKKKMESAKEYFWNNHEKRMKDLKKEISMIDDSTDPEKERRRFLENMQAIDEMLRKLREPRTRASFFAKYPCL